MSEQKPDEPVEEPKLTAEELGKLNLTKTDISVLGDVKSLIAKRTKTGKSRKGGSKKEKGSDEFVTLKGHARNVDKSYQKYKEMEDGEEKSKARLVDKQSLRNAMGTLGTKEEWDYNSVLKVLKASGKELLHHPKPVIAKKTPETPSTTK